MVLFPLQFPTGRRRLLTTVLENYLRQHAPSEAWYVRQVDPIPSDDNRASSRSSYVVCNPCGCEEHVA